MASPPVYSLRTLSLFSPWAFPQPLQHRLIFPFTKLWRKGLILTLPSVIKSCISLLWLGLHPRYQSPLPSVVVTFFQGQGSLTLLGTHCSAHDRNKPKDLSEYIQSREERALERAREASIHFDGLRLLQSRNWGPFPLALNKGAPEKRGQRRP